MTDIGAYIRQLRSAAREAMVQGRAFEQKAEEARLIAEQAFDDTKDMKTEGRSRVRKGTFLPDSEPTSDFRTNQYRVVQDAKGDFVLYMTTIANTYASLANMKYAKATALHAEIATWQEAALLGD